MVNSVGSATTANQAFLNQLEQNSAQETSKQIQQEQAQTVQDNNELAAASGSDVRTITP